MLRRAIFRPVIAFAFATGAVVGVWACSEEPTAEEPGPAPKLTMSISPNRGVKADGSQTVDVSVIAVEADGRVGSGVVVFKVAVGELDGTKGDVQQELINGQASVSYRCANSAVESCGTSQQIRAFWKSATAAGKVYFEEAVEEQPDGGLDGGTEADAGWDAGFPDTGPQLANLRLSSSRDRLFYNVGDYTDLEARLTTLDGGVAMPGEEVLFECDMGGLTATALAPDAGVPETSSSLKVTTGADGVAKARLYEAGKSGTYRVSAKHEETNAQAFVDVQVVTVRQISWEATRCSGVTCTMMGVKGSGFNEQAQVSFRVVDASGQPVSGVLVKFDAPNKPSDLSVAPDGMTDEAGIVTANVSSGRSIGAFTVHAYVAVAPEVEATSQTIPIRGAKPANFGTIFSCNNTNVPAFMNWSEGGIASIDVTCELKLIDRYGNPVGTGTTVGFKTEAGSIPNDAVAQPYAPGGNNTMEGRAAVVFNTWGFDKPVDVTPLPADPGQWPYPRSEEPSITPNPGSENPLVANPRDGLVTLIAYVRGEEFFWDDNANGVYDPGETFIDSGEPFVDANDNGVWDQGEIFIDEGKVGPDGEEIPANGVWDPPNGKWDDNTTIWVSTRVLFTGGPAAIVFEPDPFAGRCGTPDAIRPGSLRAVTVHAWDANLNRLAGGMTNEVRLVGDKGSLQWTNLSPYLDRFGMDIERRLVDADNGYSCTTHAHGLGVRSNRCVWKTLFYHFGQGTPAFPGETTIYGSGIVRGSKPGDTTPCEDIHLNTTVTLRNVTWYYSSDFAGIDREP